jgi:hypothetical protein
LRFGINIVVQDQNEAAAVVMYTHKVIHSGNVQPLKSALVFIS